MPFQTAQPVPVVTKIGEANWWGVTSIEIQTPIAGELAVSVTVQARKVDADGQTELWAADPARVHVTGAPLGALMGAAWARAQAAAQAGASGDAALYVGIRDAVYAALQTDGLVPAGATLTRGA